VYRRLCQLLHPDVGGELTPERAELWHQVQDAYAAGDAVRLDTILARVEQADGQEVRPRTIAELLDLRRHYDRARQQLRTLLHRVQKHPAWQFRQRKEASLLRLEHDATRELRAATTAMRHRLEALRRAVEPPRKAANPKRPKPRPLAFGPDELFG
jgi:phosphoglycerate-specific signal transduction histidine kinase